MAAVLSFTQWKSKLNVAASFTRHPLNRNVLVQSLLYRQGDDDFVAAL
jgi:hypothetical protein